MIRENADASFSSYLTRLNSDDKWQGLQQKHLQNVSTSSSSLILPPVDFAFSYSYGIIGETNNTISSEHKVYIKENAAARPTNITFTLSTDEMQRIWMSTMETNFFQIRNNFTENCDTSGNCILVAPEHYYILKVTGNNNTKTVIARESYAFPQDQEYQKFKSLVDQIDRITKTLLSQENDDDDDDKTLPSDHSEPERGYL
jgi:hypothetical protein